MKAVICQINSKYIHSSLSAWSLYAGTKNYCNEGIKVSVVEGTINENISDTIERINKEKPDVIGFSCYIWNIDRVRLIIKEFSDKIIILGGPEVSYNAKSIITDENIDYVITGEGEKAFSCLLNDINNKKAESKIVDGNSNFDIEPPSPYCEEYFSSLDGRIAYIESSRGCPFSCAFCLSGTEGTVRYFDLNRIKNEILMLSKTKTKTIKFVDRTFNSNPKRSKEIIDYIISISNDNSKCYHFEIAGDILTDELIDSLIKAPKGLFQVEIGLQSFNEKTLESIDRKTNLSKLTNNIKTLADSNNLHVHIDLIAGLPYEDMESFIDSFNKAYELKPDMLQLGFLKLLHGSKLRGNTEKYPCSYNENAPYEVLETPYMTHDELMILKGVEEALDRLYNSGRFKRTLEYLIETLNQKPFDFYQALSAFLSNFNLKNISLDDFVKLIFEYGKSQKNISGLVLRDKLVMDLMCTRATTMMPKCLFVEDKNLHKIKKELKSKDMKRNIQYLYSEHKTVYCDYDFSDPVTKEYKLIILDS